VAEMPAKRLQVEGVSGGPPMTDEEHEEMNWLAVSSHLATLLSFAQSKEKICKNY
jgi:hypothetical protein